MSLLDLIREFVALSDESEWGGDSLPRVKELMMELRRRGFSSFEVSELSGDRWSSSIIRVYTKGWGLVTDLSEKKRLFSDLRKLASSRHSLEDVEWFNRVDGSIKRLGSTPEAVAELNAEMGKLGLAPGEVGEMLAVSRQLRDEPGGVVGVKDRIALDKELRDQGITHKALLNLQKKCIEYGGLSGVIVGMELYTDVQVINKEYLRLDKICKDNETKNIELEDSIRRSQQVIDSLNEVYHLGWTPLTILAFPLWLRKSDTPESIRQALVGTRSIQDQQERINDLTRRNSALAIENQQLLLQHIGLADSLVQLAQELGLERDLNKRREELKRRLNLIVRGEDVLTFFGLLNSPKYVDPKSGEVNQTILTAISNFILAVELDNEAAAWRQAAKYLDQAKTEFENILNIQKIMKIAKIDDSK